MYCVYIVVKFIEYIDIIIINKVDLVVVLDRFFLIFYVSEKYYFKF